MPVLFEDLVYPGPIENRFTAVPNWGGARLKSKGSGPGKPNFRELTPGTKTYPVRREEAPQPELAPITDLKAAGFWDPEIIPLLERIQLAGEDAIKFGIMPWDSPEVENQKIRAKMKHIAEKRKAEMKATVDRTIGNIEGSIEATGDKAEAGWYRFVNKQLKQIGDGEFQLVDLVALMAVALAAKSAIGSHESSRSQRVNEIQKLVDSTPRYSPENEEDKKTEREKQEEEWLKRRPLW